MKQVLIVDDAIDLGRLLMQALKTVHPNLSIRVVPSGEEAILESTRIHIDLLITDIRLPGISGFDLVRKIRLRQPNIKVMVISGLSLDERMKKQLDETCPDTFMQKPMSMPDFQEKAAGLLGLSGVLPVPSQVSPSSNDDLLSVLAEAMPGIPVNEITIKPAAEKKEERSQPLQHKGPIQADSTGLSGCLSSLRGSLGAMAAMLLDDRARPVAQAGDLPDASLMEAIAPAALAALSAGARLSYLAGLPVARAVQAFRGKDFDLVLSPVGQYALMLVLKPGKTSLRLALAFEEALAAEEVLSAALEEMGLHVQSAVEVGAPDKVALAAAEEYQQEPPQGDLLNDAAAGPLVDDPGLEKLEDLFAQTTSGAIDLDADTFWEAAAGAEKANLDTPGVLSFEQAQKLGLLPSEE